MKEPPGIRLLPTPRPSAPPLPSGARHPPRYHEGVTFQGGANLLMPLLPKSLVSPVPQTRDGFQHVWRPYDKVKPRGEGIYIKRIMTLLLYVGQSMETMWDKIDVLDQGDKTVSLGWAEFTNTGALARNSGYRCWLKLLGLFRVYMLG